MNEPRLLDVDEAEALEGASVEVVVVGGDGIAFRNDAGMLFLVTLCLGCGSHIGFYEIDEDMLASSDPDISAS